MSTALTDIGTVVTSALSIITGNAVLYAMFAGALLGVGFKVIRAAKRAAK